MAAEAGGRAHAVFGDDIGHVRKLAAALNVEDAEANACGGEVLADGELDGGEAVVGEHVRAGDDREHVHAPRQAPDGADVALGEGWTAEQRVGCDRRLEDDWLEVRLRKTAGAVAGHHVGSEGGDRGRDNLVGVQEIDASNGTRSAAEGTWAAGRVTHRWTWWSPPMALRSCWTR